MESLSDTENFEGQLRSSEVKSLQWSYGGETWWIESSSDVENVEGQLGVIKGQMGTNPCR